MDVNQELQKTRLEYKQVLERYKNMSIWIETATPEQIKKFESEVFNVINECERLYNRIKELELLDKNQISLF